MNQQQTGMNRFKDYYRANPWKSRLMLASATFIIILVIARLMLTPSIIYGATSWLKKSGIDSHIEDVDFDIFDGTVSLINATGTTAGKPLFNIGLVEIHWRWTPLSEKTVAIDSVVLDQIKVDIEQYSDELIIGGVHVPLTDAQAEEQQVIELAEKPRPWAAALGEVVFSNIDICYLQDSATASTTTPQSRVMDYCVELQEMTWGGTISYGTDPALKESGDIPLSSTGDFNLNGLTVVDNRLDKYLLRSSANTLTEVTITGLNNIGVKRLEMNALSALDRKDDEHHDAVRFSQLAVDNIRIDNLNTLSIGAISLDAPGLYIVKLTENDWEYAQWLPGKSSTAENKSDQNKADDEASPFNIKLADITVTGSDFCYLDKHLDSYDCFTEDALRWKGKIDISTGDKEDRLSIAGDLTAENTRIYNPNLARNLLHIDVASLEGLNIRKTDDLSLLKLNISNLSALQRGSEAADNTVTFKDLTINDTRFKGDRVDIKDITLSELASKLTKNKDGSFEHEKWLQGSQPENKDSADKKEVKPADDKPLQFSIGKVRVNTEQEILFVDDSTDPTMTIGLNKLNVKANNIDSAKPDSEVDFDVSGKTTRHSTIELAGKAKPFAEKVSMDAKGKLKGFDLRAATPATKKAIGHIIKSGQLDADLTLLATDGILDSKVALSLYHFNIKAQSKEDAAKLDKQFGMPLNQTLVLLRDKDDSIHLDIPITGDVNNPDFNPMDAIVKATSKAATVTLITFYTPYGLVYAGGNVLFDMATALDFEPIKFEPGSSDIDAVDISSLDGMAKMMKEKPGIHLTLCGVTNKDDVANLFPELKEKQEQAKSEGKKDKDIPQLSEEQKATLNKLAHERQDKSKNRLIEKYSIEHNRLILCEPEHDDDSISGVEINI